MLLFRVLVSKLSSIKIKSYKINPKYKKNHDLIIIFHEDMFSYFKYMTYLMILIQNPNLKKVINVRLDIDMQHAIIPPSPTVPLLLPFRKDK